MKNNIVKLYLVNNANGIKKLLTETINNKEVVQSRAKRQLGLSAKFVRDASAYGGFYLNKDKTKKIVVEFS
jgi:hypothetical protein